MRVILYSGKGGTGKSVISCATALRCAELGYNTLVMSADPAHTLADAFETRLGGEIENLTKHLWAIQIDPAVEMSRSYVPIQDYLASVFSSKGVDETIAYEISSLPTMTYLFAMLRMQELAETGQYDVLILDTVPSGEALRYLYFPKLIGRVSRKIIRLMGPMAGLVKLAEPLIGVPAPTRKVLNKEIELVEKLEKLSFLLQDDSVSSLRLIANPDTFSIENLKRTLMISSLHGINTDLVLLNKIIPQDVKDPYFSQWKESQEKKIKDIESGVYPLQVRKLRLYDSELKGIEMLRSCASDLFSKEDPTRVYYRGSPFKIESSDREVVITIKVPFSEKTDFDVERIGEELILKVQTGMGEAINVIPLPMITMKMKLIGARLLRDTLQITFKEEDRAENDR